MAPVFFWAPSPLLCRLSSGLAFNVGASSGRQKPFGHEPSSKTCARASQSQIQQHRFAAVSHGAMQHR